MRVLIPDAGNPPASFIRNLVSTLDERGIEIDLTAPPPQGRVKARLRNRGLLPEDHKIAEAVEQADLVHFQWPPSYIAYGQLARRTGKPVVLSLRGRLTNIVPYLPGKEGYRHVLNQHLPLCNAYHCVSQDVMERAIPLGLARERAKVIRPAIDTTLFSPTPSVPSRQLRILMVGGLIWRKGYEYALVALKHLDDAGYSFMATIIGEGPDRERIEWTIRDLDFSSKVTLAGSVPHREISEALKYTDVFLHTSLSEGIANSVLEAMASGVPVVVWDAGGMCEAIVDGGNGRLVKARDIEATWRAIAEVSDEPGMAKVRAIEARKRVLQDFDLATRADDFIDLYELALQKGSLS